MVAVSKISTYSDLQSAVADYLIRGDLTPQIQLAISFAEAEFNRTIRNKRMEARDSTTTIAGQEYLALPDDYLEVRTMNLMGNPRVPLQFKTPTQIDTFYTTPYHGQPEVFSIEDDEFRLAPIPDSDDYLIEILYYQSIPPLGGSDASGNTITTNWLLLKHPDMYLFQTLLQMSVILKDSEIGSAVSAFYQNAKVGLETEEKREQWGGSPMIPSTDAWMR